MSSRSSISRTVPATADVVIIGGGVMGTSIAFHLAEAGVRRIVVIERDELGSGSSGKPIGGVRAQFSDPLNIALGSRSLRAWQNFGQRPGADIRLAEVGYLFLLTSAEQAADFETGVRIQNELGVPSRLIGPREAQRLCPYVSTDGLVAAAYSPADGHARPRLAVRGYARAAARAGVVFAPHTAVTGLDTTGDRVTAVHTDHGRISCATVICAAGAWSAAIGDMAGVPLPVRPVRRQLAFTAPSHRPPPASPSPSTSPRRLTSTTATTGCCSASPTPARPRASTPPGHRTGSHCSAPPHGTGPPPSRTWRPPVAGPDSTRSPPTATR